MKKITPHLYQINLGAVNAFLIEDEDLTLVDAGYPGHAAKIFAAIRKAGKDPAQIKRVLITHAHPDHVGGLATIADKQALDIYMHPKDADLMEKGMALRPNLKPAPNLLFRLMAQMLKKEGAGKVAPVQVTHRVSDGEIIPVAGGLEVIHTPGHSAGHIAFLLKKDRVLIAGDICGNVLGLGYSIVYEDITLGMQSILKAANYDFDKAVFGHGKALMKSANDRLKAKFQGKVHAS